MPAGSTARLLDNDHDMSELCQKWMHDKAPTDGARPVQAASTSTRHRRCDHMLRRNA
jgi:hypothetical protein